jgi:hypothetical protein
MSTVKISQLPLIAALNANTANSLFMGVDIPTGVTGKFTTHTLAQGLYSNEVLNVGGNPVLYSNVIGQFAGNSEVYLQINLQNLKGNGSSDFVASTSDSDNNTKYIDMGISGNTFSDPATYSAFKAYDGYLYTYGPNATSAQGNLILGTASSNANVVMLVGGLHANNIVGWYTKNGISLNTQSYITFADGTIQHTAAVSNAYIQAAFAAANTAATNIAIMQGVNTTQNTNITTANNAAWAAYAVGNTNATNITDVNTYAGSAYAAGNTNATNITAVNTYAASAYAAGNTNATNITVIQGVNSSQNTFTQAAFDKANTSVQNTAVITVNSITLTGNLIANGLGQSASIDNFTSNSATFNKDITVLGNLVANTLLGNVFFSNVVTGTSQANAILWFPQTVSPTQTSGQVWYSSNTISLVLDTDIPRDRPSIGKVIWERVYNSSGSTISSNSWVKLVGAVTSNGIPYVNLADATTSANSIVAGFVKESIANGSYGFIYTQGIVEDLNLNNFTPGDLIFLSTTPGLATNVAPVGQSLASISLAKILNTGSSNGKIQIGIAAVPAYGKANGSILYANNNLIVASNTVVINESAGTVYIRNGLQSNTRSYSGNQTTATLNFLTDTWVRANIAANFAVTLGNFVAGSEVHLWVTNTSTGGGAAHTITHGCSALNSTVGATTFTLSGGTSARLKYYSFDSDLANTYVTVSY